MILIDRSVWIDHLRSKDAALATLLEHRRVLIHPFVIGELALGSLRQRTEIIEDLQNLPQSIVADDDEVMIAIDRQALFGRGIGYIDAHLPTPVRLAPDASLWNRDKRRHAVVTKAGIGFRPPTPLGG